jgi:UMF1 family MFS transporter
MESAFIFYNSFLPQLKRGSGIGKMSALGFGTGYLGSIVSLFLSFLLVQKKLVKLVWPFCSLFFSYSLCLYSLSFPLKDPIKSSILFSAKKGLSETLRLMRTLFKDPDLKRFFLAYLFYEDGINTVIVFSSIYDLFLYFFF